MGLLSGTDQSYYEGSDYGNYQFTSLQDIISQFMTAYVGQEKIISKASRVDVAFHAQRALAEMSFDTFKSTKAQEITKLGLAIKVVILMKTIRMILTTMMI
jgi:tRNA U38,U39,U40 pseudouridine synthase TruA